MIVVTMDNASENIRGFLTRWLLEVRPSCFVGSVTAQVREQIWEGIVSENTEYLAGATMVYSTDTEQGFDIRMIGNPKRYVTDYEGIKLITYKTSGDEKNMEAIG